MFISFTEICYLTSKRLLKLCDCGSAKEMMLGKQMWPTFFVCEYVSRYALHPLKLYLPIETSSEMVDLLSRILVYRLSFVELG